MKQKPIEDGNNKSKLVPNMRVTVTMTADIRSHGLEQLKQPGDMEQYVRFVISSSRLGYDPLGWMKHRDELGLRMGWSFGAAYRPPNGKKWREVDCSSLTLASKGRKGK